jgi:hypothetical protein
VQLKSEELWISYVLGYDPESFLLRNAAAPLKSDVLLDITPLSMLINL